MAPRRSRAALITGFSGQDGSYLSELLLEQGYRVTGMVRSDAAGVLGSSEHLRSKVKLIYGDLLDPASLRAAVSDSCPDELYHLAAPSFVPDSWERPAETIAAIAGATATLLEAVRDATPQTRVFLATSSTVFGATPESPQREETATYPQNPYAVAKLAAHQLVGQLRAHAGLYVCSGILYNHESERRPEHFVSRKITRGAASIKLGHSSELVVGDLEAIRDWSFAGDIVRGAWLMLGQERPEDYILASGIAHTVGELAEIAFSHLGLEASDHIRVDPRLARAPDPVVQVGDPSRARRQLGWAPKLSFEELITRMVNFDLRALAGEREAARP